MAGKQTQFEVFLTEEVGKYKGIYVPVKSSLLRRALIRRMKCKKLHPNPGDEFCDPQIGPNYEAVSSYEHEIWTARKRHQKQLISEPLMVERIRPEGYILLNGHHRWAAAVRMSVPRVPVRIVNLTQEMDVQRMLRSARHDRRVTLDLDEVVFLADPNAPAERALPLPLRHVYRKRLRLGVPALFHFLKTSGYDIWVYSANYYSMEDIRAYFKRYHARVDGIVTGTSRKSAGGEAARSKLESMMASRYVETIHIDSRSVLRINGSAGKFAEFPLSGDNGAWSREIMEIMGAWEKPEA